MADDDDKQEIDEHVLYPDGSSDQYMLGPADERNFNLCTELNLHTVSILSRFSATKRPC